MQKKLWVGFYQIGAILTITLCHDLGHIGSFGVMKMSLLVMIKETSNVLALLYMPQIMVWRGKPCGGFWRGFRLKLTI